MGRYRAARATRDEERWVGGGIEGGGKPRPVFQRGYIGALSQNAADASASERAPELGWEQKRQRRPIAQQVQRPFDEEGGKVHLRGKSLARMCRLRSVLPRCAREHRVCSAK